MRRDQKHSAPSFTLHASGSSSIHTLHALLVRGTVNVHTLLYFKPCSMPSMAINLNMTTNCFRDLIRSDNLQPCTYGSTWSHTTTGCPPGPVYAVTALCFRVQMWSTRKQQFNAQTSSFPIAAPTIRNSPFVRALIPHSGFVPKAS